MRANERRLKELAFQVEDDYKNQTKLQDLIDKLQNKLNFYKKQAENAEEMAAVNLKKFRRAQTETGTTEEKIITTKYFHLNQDVKSNDIFSLPRSSSLHVKFYLFSNFSIIDLLFLIARIETGL